MKHTEPQADLASIIANAENAVANVKDNRLREIAFERVLDHLLISSDQSGALRRIGKRPIKSTPLNQTPKAERRKKEGPLSWLRELTEEGFFVQPKSLKDILKELSNRSHRLRPTDLTLPLQTLCHERKLRRERQSASEGEKKVFHWYNW